MKKIALYFLIFLILVSCHRQATNKPDNHILLTESVLSNSDCYIIDLDVSVQDDALKTSSIFKTVRPIILKSPDDVLIGRINSIQVYEDKMFIMDKLSNGIFSFNKDGEFLNRIGKIGQAPEEYINPSDFTLDTVNKKIYVLDYDLQKINVYDINTGKYINNIKLDNNKVRSYNIQYYNGSLYTDAFFPKDNENNFLLRELDISTGQQKRCWLSASQYNKGFSGLYFTGKDLFLSRTDKPLFSQVLMDTIMSINMEGIKPYLAIKSKTLLTAKDYSDAKGDNFTEKMSSLMTKNVKHSIRDFVDIEDMIFFKYQQRNFMSFVIFNKKKNHYQIFKTMKDDLLYSLENPPLPNFVGYDKRGIYSSINVDELLLENIKNSGLVQSLTKREELMQLTADSNPIIFYYEIKK